MKNEKHSVDKIIFGFIVGSLIGGAGFILAKASPQERKLFLHKIEKVITSLGHSLHGIDTDKAKGVLEEIKKGLPKSGMISNTLDILKIGVNVWEQIDGAPKKKGSKSKKTGD